MKKEYILLGLAAVWAFLKPSSIPSPYSSIPSNIVSDVNPAMTERFEAKLIDSGINPQTFGTILPVGSTARRVSDAAFAINEVQPLFFNGRPISETPEVYKLFDAQGNDFSLSFQTYNSVLQGFAHDTQQAILTYGRAGYTPNTALQGLFTRQGYAW